MSRFTWLGAAALTIALGAAMPAAAQTQDQPAQTQQQQSFTDAQISAFAAASVEADPISRSLANATPEQQAQGATQLREILTRHNIDATTYNSIATQAQTDTALAARIRAAQPGEVQPSNTEEPPPTE